MRFDKNVYSEEEFKGLVDEYLEKECEDAGSLEVAARTKTHTQCGGTIRIGFVHCFAVDERGGLDSGHDGFGLGPRAVPYCENCDPPDGFNSAYALRIGIKK